MVPGYFEEHALRLASVERVTEKQCAKEHDLCDQERPHTDNVGFVLLIQLFELVRNLAVMTVRRDFNAHYAQSPARELSIVQNPAFMALGMALDTRSSVRPVVLLFVARFADQRILHALRYFLIPGGFFR